MLTKKSGFINNTKIYFALHIELLLFSLGNVCSKKASEFAFMSFGFIFFYAIVILNLAIYAFVWQQIIKRLPLTTAFANKAVTVVWGLVWGALFFNEAITAGKIIGAALVIIGVIVYAKAGEESEA